MPREDWIRNLFAGIDNLDADAFATFLSDRAVFRLGNAESVTGKEAVTEMVRGFFGSIGGIRHEITEIWEQRDTVICNGMVTYTRHDATSLTVPFANILKLEEELVQQYLVYVDVSELYVSA